MTEARANSDAPTIPVRGDSALGSSPAPTTPETVGELRTVHGDRLHPTDEADLIALWEENRRWVAAILLAHKPRYADLDDLLQEVALTVLRHGPEVRDPGSFRPWLRTVAINAARLAARAGRLRQHLSMDEPREDRPGSDGLAANTQTADTGTAKVEEADRLLKLAAGIPEGYREPLLLKALRDLSYREIGAIMGLPETTIETRIARGRRMLRELAAANLASE